MTLSYRLDMFDRADPELVRAAPRPYEALVLCAPDFPSCKLAGMAVGSPRTIRQAIQPTVLVATEGLVAGLAGDPELPA